MRGVPRTYVGTLDRCEPRRRSRVERPLHHAGEHRGGHGPARAARRDRGPVGAGGPPGPVERPRGRAEGHQPAVARPGRPAARRGAAPPPRRPPGALRARRGGGRRGVARRGRRRASEAARRHPELEVRTLLSGEYDAREALVTIRSEAGGVDAADFAEMLMRMYLRWAERHGYAIDVYDTSYAEEAGIKSATFQVQAPVRLRDAVGRAGHAPAGAHLAVRQPGPPADLVRRRRGGARS